MRFFARPGRPADRASKPASDRHHDNAHAKVGTNLPPETDLPTPHSFRASSMPARAAWQRHRCARPRVPAIKALGRDLSTNSLVSENRFARMAEAIASTRAKNPASSADRVLCLSAERL